VDSQFCNKLQCRDSGFVQSLESQPLSGLVLLPPYTLFAELQKHHFTPPITPLFAELQKHLLPQYTIPKCGISSIEQWPDV
jgi:hypothetical protein